MNQDTDAKLPIGDIRPEKLLECLQAGRIEGVSYLDATEASDEELQLFLARSDEDSVYNAIRGVEERLRQLDLLQRSEEVIREQRFHQISLEELRKHPLWENADPILGTIWARFDADR